MNRFRTVMAAPSPARRASTVRTGARGRASPVSRPDDRTIRRLVQLRLAQSNAEGAIVEFYSRELLPSADQADLYSGARTFGVGALRCQPRSDNLTVCLK
jgi:hypothetical protein